MFDKLRDPTKNRSSFKKYMYIFLFAIIIATFVLMTGTGAPIGGAAGGIAAEVNDKIITQREFDRAYTNRENQMRQQFQGLPAAMRQQYLTRQLQGLRPQVLEQLINYELTKQLASDSGIFVSPDQLRKRITDIPSFQENGQFQVSKYQQLLQANNINTSVFEEGIKGEIAFGRFRDIFLNTVKATSADVELSNFAKSQKINVDFIEISEQLLKKNIVVSEAEINDFNAKEADKVKKYYEENKSNYEVKKKTKASHILIKTKSQSADDYAVALEKTKKVLSEINEKNFAEIAKKYSEDTGSKVKGGELGEFDDNVSFVPPFKKAVLSLPVGKLSEPIKTTFGYHIIKVTGKTPAKTKSLDEVKNDIAKKFISDTKVEKDMTSLTNGGKGVSMDAINAIKDKYKVKWQSTGIFSLDQTNIPKLGNKNKVWQAISELNNNSETKLIESDGKYYVVKLNEVKFEPIKTANSDEEIINLSQKRAGDAVQSFVEAEAKNARIRRNLRLINN